MLRLRWCCSWEYLGFSLAAMAGKTPKSKIKGRARKPIRSRAGWILCRRLWVYGWTIPFSRLFWLSFLAGAFTCFHHILDDEYDDSQYPSSNQDHVSDGLKHVETKHHHISPLRSTKYSFWTSRSSGKNNKAVGGDMGGPWEQSVVVCRGRRRSSRNAKRSRRSTRSGRRLGKTNVFDGIMLSSRKTMGIRRMW